MTAPGTLEFTPGDADWEKLRQRGLKDLYFFAGVVLNYGDLIPMREGPHYLLTKFVARQTGIPDIDNAPYRKVEMPRETGKSALITRCYTIWRLTKARVEDGVDLAVLITNEKAENAIAFLSEIKSHFETNELFRTLYPEMIPPDFQKTTWSASEIVLPRLQPRVDPSVGTSGVGGSKTGMHPDLIICDDIISREAMENAKAGSWQIMHQANRWIHQLEPLLNSNARPYPEILFIGTRWWHNDCYDHIEEAFGYGEAPRRYLIKCILPTGEKQAIEVYRTGRLAVFRRSAIEGGHSIFPEKWDLERLAQIRLVDPQLFAANYMNQPSDVLTATFKEAWLLTYNWLDERQIQWIDGDGARHSAPVEALDVYVLVDPGGFSSRGTEDRARAAIVVTGITAQGDIMVLDCYSEQDTYVVAQQQVLLMAERYGARKIAIEQAAQQLQFIDEIRRQVGLRGIPAAVEMVRPGVKSKAQRILGLEAWFQRGKVYIGNGPRFHEFRTQYEQFPNTRRVDLLDALAYGPLVWPRVQRHAADPQTRRAQELSAYYSRRGLTPGAATHGPQLWHPHQGLEQGQVHRQGPRGG